MSVEEKKLHAEIKQLLKEASTLTQPSTFAQAAKLRRMAAAKEKQLAKYQERQMMERKSSYDPYMKYVTPVKALTYLVLGVWFWKSPVASIPKELPQPIGRCCGLDAIMQKSSQPYFWEVCPVRGFWLFWLKLVSGRLSTNLAPAGGRKGFRLTNFGRWFHSCRSCWVDY